MPKPIPKLYSSLRVVKGRGFSARESMDSPTAEERLYGTFELGGNGHFRVANQNGRRLIVTAADLLDGLLEGRLAAVEG